MKFWASYLIRVLFRGRGIYTGVVTAVVIWLDANGSAPDLPRWAYLAIGLLAMFISAGRIHSDDQREIQELKGTGPQIEFAPLDGSDYSFELSDASAEMPMARVRVHLRLRNGGPKEVKLTSVKGDLERALPVMLMQAGLDSGRWQLTFPNPDTPLDKNGKSLGTAHVLKPGQTVVLTVIGEAGPTEGINPGEFAARLREEPAHEAGIPVVFEAKGLDHNNERWGQTAKHEIRPAALDELYLEKWRKENKQELLELAGAT